MQEEQVEARAPQQPETEPYEPEEENAEATLKRITTRTMKAKTSARSMTRKS